MIKKKQTPPPNRNETNPTVSKFTGTGTSTATPFKANGTGNSRARRVYRPKMAVPPARGRHRLPSPAALRNRRACGVRTSQLIQQAADGGQLGPKGENAPSESHRPPEISLQQLPGSPPCCPTTELEETTLNIYFPVPLRGQAFWGRTW